MRKSLLVLAMGIVLMLAVVSCASGGTGSTGGSAGSLNTDMTEMKYTPATWTATAGQAATITAKNSGTLVHDWIVRGMEGQTKLEVQPGQTGSKTFTIATAGSYEVYCSQPGHFEGGMKGTLTVQ